MRDLLLAHLADHYQFYGELPGVRTARKHIGWYVSSLPSGKQFSDLINTIESTHAQFEAVNQWFTRQHTISPDIPAATCDNQDLNSGHLYAA
jgi:tRNA-dihydrouridine synthase B